MKYETILVDRVVAETDAAFLFDIDGSETWVPKSVVEDADGIGKDDEEIEVNIAAWFADKYGLGM